MSAQRGAPPRAFELRADDPKFHDLIAADAKLEKVAGGFGFTEGPVWSDTGFLYVSDEQQNKISRVFPDGRVETVLEIRDPDGAALTSGHRLVVCLSTLRKLIAVEPSGQYTVLAETYQGKRLNSVNDVVVGPDGALYFTDPTIDVPKGETTELPTTVYRLSERIDYRLEDNGTRIPLPPAISLKALTTDLAQPNGLAFSPDGKRLYVTDTQRREIRVFDVVMKNGMVDSLANNRLLGKEDGTGGVPDGLKVDAKGNLFVTGPLGVWVWDANGHHLGTIVLPETPANLGWGDADRSTLYFTAKSSVYRLRTKTGGPVAGRRSPAAG